MSYKIKLRQFPQSHVKNKQRSRSEHLTGYYNAGLAHTAVNRCRCSTQWKRRDSCNSYYIANYKEDRAEYFHSYLCIMGRYRAANNCMASDYAVVRYIFHWAINTYVTLFISIRSVTLKQQMDSWCPRLHLTLRVDKYVIVMHFWNNCTCAYYLFFFLVYVFLKQVLTIFHAIWFKVRWF